jgi:signal transduction histidine kinase
VVADSGIGMAPGVLERAFEPFFTTKPIGDAVGLGLSMVLSFARQSSGFVELSSKSGKGTVACLALPIISVPAGQRDSDQGGFQPG